MDNEHIIINLFKRRWQDKQTEQRTQSKQASQKTLQNKEKFSGDKQGLLGRFKDFIEDKFLDIELAIESRRQHSSDLKAQQLIKRAFRHRLDKREIIELLVSIGYSQEDAGHPIKSFFKKSDKSNQTRLR